MNLISQIFLIILIACFTGTVSLGFWRVFQPLLLKRDPRLVYVTLRFVCMMYIVPFGYLIVRLTWHGVFAVDCDAMQAFDQIDVLNKSALIYIAAKNMGFEPDGMSREQMKEMTVAFNLPK